MHDINISVQRSGIRISEKAVIQDKATLIRLQIMAKALQGMYPHAKRLGEIIGETFAKTKAPVVCKQRRLPS